MFGKITIYLDADDTILRSSEAIIKMINERFGTEKTIDDLCDWNYQSVCPKMNEELVQEMYSSDRFFELVELDSGFKEFYENNRKKFKWVVVTKGTPENLAKKKAKVRELLGNGVEYIGLPLSASKKRVDMRGGIQIDDRVDCLDTKATLRVLVTLGRMLPWNHYMGGEEDFYIVRDMGEVAEVCEFAAKNHKLFGLEKK